MKDFLGQTDRQTFMLETTLKSHSI